MGGCLRSGYKRCFFRRSLLKKIVQQQHGIIVTDSEDEDDDHLMLPQTNFQMMCVHRGCGCYMDDSRKGLVEGRSDIETEGGSRDLCACLFKTFANSCCGKIFGYHWQICGTCALAQEGRQLDSMVHIDKRRMDYVTFQFFTDYFNQIRKLREENDGNILNHCKALSKLSHMIVTLFAFTILVVFSMSIAKIPESFRFGDMIVFVATFLHAFLILYLVYWQLHRFDLSLDAVIKYFASGFILSITSAIFFEVVISLILQLFLTIIMPAQVANNEQYSEYGPYVTFIEHSPWNMYSDGDGYQKAFHTQHPFLSTIVLFLNAYVVAALVEELTKYFGFIMVEHPDFLCDSELEAAADFSACDGEDDESAGGGEESDEDSVAEAGVGDDHCDSFEGGKLCRGMATGNRAISSRFLGDNADVDVFKQQRVELHPAPPRSSRSVGAGITIAMVSVALGFACCENLIYIFLYHGDNLQSEIIVLMFRSLFPVHPLCAAIQSIGVCKHLLENDRSMRLGRIIFPAIILHGSYDFVIMFLSFLANSNEDGGGGEFWVTSLSLILSFASVLMGWMYYLKESKAQTNRLNRMDADKKFTGVSC